MSQALIVGASRGIGAAIAARLECDGWGVTDLSRTSGVDVTEPEELDQALYDAARLKPKALIYCAGHVTPGPLTEISREEWDYTLAVNLTGAFRCLAWYASWQWTGAIVLVASTAALRPSPDWAAYAAAKAALVNLALTAAVELAPRGIRVYCVAPGRCATQLRRILAPDEDQTAIMQPGEVADVVATLVSDHAGVLAGQVIEIARR